MAICGCRQDSAPRAQKIAQLSFEEVISLHNASPAPQQAPRLRRFWFVPVICVLLLVAIAAAVLLITQQIRSVTSPRLPVGISVKLFPWDERTMPIGGMTAEEAQNALINEANAFVVTPCIPLTLHGVSVPTTPADIGITANINDCVQTAWLEYTRGTLEERIQRVSTLKKTGLVVPLNWECKSDVLSAYANSLSSVYTEDVSDAFLIGWKDGRPEFSDFTPAKQIDAHALAGELVTYVQYESFGQPLAFDRLASLPKESHIQKLEEKIIPLGRADVPSDAMIQAATLDVVTALNGMCLKPGETLDLEGYFVSLPGEKYAKDGSLISSRLGTALFQASVVSGLTTTRWPGIIGAPPEFIDPGLEAMAWEKSTVTVTNSSDHAIILLTGDDGAYAWAEFRGEPILSAGQSLELKSVITQTEPAPTKPRLINDPTLLVGEEIQQSPASLGVTAEVYLVTTDNGKQKQEKKDQLSYPAQPEIIRIGTKKK